MLDLLGSIDDGGNFLLAATLWLGIAACKLRLAPGILQLILKLNFTRFLFVSFGFVFFFFVEAMKSSWSNQFHWKTSNEWTYTSVWQKQKSPVITDAVKSMIKKKKKKKKSHYNWDWAMSYLRTVFFPLLFTYCLLYWDWATTNWGMNSIEVLRIVTWKVAKKALVRFTRLTRLWCGPKSSGHNGPVGW